LAEHWDLPNIGIFYSKDATSGVSHVRCVTVLLNVLAPKKKFYRSVHFSFVSKDTCILASIGCYFTGLVIIVHAKKTRVGIFRRIETLWFRFRHSVELKIVKSINTISEAEP
jgi:hypothetical protein